MPKLLVRQYAKILYHITKDVKAKDMDKAVLEFFKLLKRNQMLKKIDIIVGEFLAYAKQIEGIDKITITSAHKLPKDVVQELAKKFSDHFEVDTKIDESLIGGVKVKKGNVIYDASVQAQLSTLQESLTN